MSARDTRTLAVNLPHHYVSSCATFLRDRRPKASMLGCSVDVRLPSCGFEGGMGSKSHSEASPAAKSS